MAPAGFDGYSEGEGGVRVGCHDLVEALLWDLKVS